MNEILNGLDYDHEHIDKVILAPGEQLTAVFFDCTFNHCSFDRAVLHQCRFKECVFKNCDFSLADISGSSFHSTLFEKSKLIGINWTRANWSGTGVGRPPVFRDCMLNHSTFIGVKLRGSRIEGCTAREVDFREADLSGVSFKGTDLGGCLFGGTNLKGADLRDAQGYDFDPCLNQVKGAMFSLPEALTLLDALGIILGDPGGDDSRVSGP